MWYDPMGIANILSFKRVSEKYVAAYDQAEQAFVVTKPDGKQFLFVESPEGLHYLYMEGDSGTMLVNTVPNNQSCYTNEDYLHAVQARELQIKISQPSLQDYIHIVTKNYLPNSPVTKANILAAETIFGPDIGSLKGKTNWCNPHAVKQVVEPLEPHVMRHYRNVTICAEVMFINSIPFSVMISCHIKFGTIQPMADREQGMLMGAIKAILSVYHWAGFVVTLALMDGLMESGAKWWNMRLC